MTNLAMRNPPTTGADLAGERDRLLASYAETRGRTEGLAAPLSA